MSQKKSERRRASSNCATATSPGWWPALVPCARAAGAPSCLCCTSGPRGHLPSAQVGRHPSRGDRPGCSPAQTSARCCRPRAFCALPRAGQRKSTAGRGQARVAAAAQGGSRVSPHTLLWVPPGSLNRVRTEASTSVRGAASQDRSRLPHLRRSSEGDGRPARMAAHWRSAPTFGPTSLAST